MQHVSPHHRVNLVPFINQYLVRGPSGWWLIDTGLPNLARLLDIRLRRRVRVPELAGCILTHGHLDHAGSALWLQRRGVPIWAGEEEVPYLRHEKRYPYASYVQPAIRWLDTNVGCPAVDPDHRVQDGDLIDGVFRVIHTPGHAPGHIALHDERSGQVICGDVILGYAGRLQGPSAPFTYDMTLAKTSARRLLDLDPTIVLPGHGAALRREYLRASRERIIDLLHG